MKEIKIERMKRFVLVAVMCLWSLSSFSQGKVYCEIIERNPNSKKVKVIIDFGQKREKNLKSQTLVDEKGNVVIFNSKIDALNYMDTLGWNFMQAYTIVEGSSYGGGGSTSSEIHWILYKELKEGEDPYRGLLTKEMQDK